MGKVKTCNIDELLFPVIDEIGIKQIFCFKILILSFNHLLILLIADTNIIVIKHPFITEKKWLTSSVISKYSVIPYYQSFSPK